MPEQIIGSPDQKMMWVGPEGQISISGVVGINGIIGSIIIGSVSANVDLGSVYIIQDVPTAGIQNNPAWQFDYMISGASTGIDIGSSIGSIVQFIGLGSYVQVITYSNNNITKIGSWV